MLPCGVEGHAKEPPNNLACGLTGRRLDTRRQVSAKQDSRYQVRPGKLQHTDSADGSQALNSRLWCARWRGLPPPTPGTGPAESTNTPLAQQSIARVDDPSREGQGTILLSCGVERLRRVRERTREMFKAQTVEPGGSGIRPGKYLSYPVAGLPHLRQTSPAGPPAGRHGPVAVWRTAAVA